MEFWDKNLSEEEIKDVLMDERNPRFVEFASLFLSRTNDIKMVFSGFLGKKAFYRNWRKIKARMRKNKWNDPRIVLWEEVYNVLKKSLKNEERAVRKERSAVSREMQDVGVTIREARERRELTQKELAKKAGLSQQTVSFIERGSINVSFLTLKKVADVLGLKISIIDEEKMPQDFQATHMTASSSLHATGR